MSKNTVMTGLLIGASFILACCGPDDPGTDGGPIDHLDGSNPDGGADGGVDAGPDAGQTDGGADAGPDVGDGGVKVDAGPDADSDWDFAKAILHGRKWVKLEKDSPTPTGTGTFSVGTFSSPDCTTGKKLNFGGQSNYCFDPSTMQYSWYEDANYYIEADFTFCNDCASYIGTVKETCLRHRHISGHCHPDWSDQWFVDGPWVIIKNTFYNGSIYKSTLAAGD